MAEAHAQHFTPADEQFLRRALHLAYQGGSAVQPNPQVGALLVADSQIIAEGWHARYGGPHAEVIAINQIADKELLARCTLYVSLEPCCHTRKQTPPCTELVLSSGIRRVVVGALDPNPHVCGKGVERLRGQGVVVALNPNPLAFHELLRPFAVNQLQHRPYVVLKWAETADGYIGNTSGQRLHISGQDAQYLTHSLRSRCQHIMIGAQTARADLPRLDTRLAPGASPHRLLLSNGGELPILPHSAQTTVIGPGGQALPPIAGYQQWPLPAELAGLPAPELLGWLWTEHRVASILVEGGATVLQQFLDAGIWDEAYRLVSKHLGGGDVAAPLPPPHLVWHLNHQTEDDLIFSNFAPNPLAIPVSQDAL